MTAHLDPRRPSRHGMLSTLREESPPLENVRPEQTRASARVVVEGRDCANTSVLPRWQRVVLYAVGAWTALGGISALADPAAHAQTFFGSADALGRSGATVVVFQIAYAQLLAWGLGYALAARRPAMRAPMLVAGALGKSLYFVLTVVAYASGGGTFALLLTGMGDLVIAVFFVLAVSSCRSTGSTAEAERVELHSLS